MEEAWDHMVYILIFRKRFNDFLNKCKRAYNMRLNISCCEEMGIEVPLEYEKIINGCYFTHYLWYCR